MVNEQKIKQDYAYKCKCGKIIKIDDEHKNFFFGHDEENKVSVLIGECPECAQETHFFRNDIEKAVFPLYTGKFDFRWE
ncbi:MAG: hypothetical protein AVO38_16170 [delta proteobacterium ML8_D]|nr:MAG: hypothetical protein AVO38_16170 [delta proteobacterium ML8_D]